MQSEDNLNNDKFSQGFSAFIDGEATTEDVIQLADLAQATNAAQFKTLNKIACQSHFIQAEDKNDYIVDVHSKIMQQIEQFPNHGEAQFKVKFASFALGWRTYIASAAVAASTVVGLVIYNQPVQSFNVVERSTVSDNKPLNEHLLVANNAAIQTQSNQLQHIDAEFDEDVARLINKHFMFSRISGGSTADINYIQAQYAKTDTK